MIGDSLRANPENFVSNLKQAKEKVKTGHYAYAFVKVYALDDVLKMAINNFLSFVYQQKLYLSVLIDLIYRENGNKCGVTYAKEPIQQFQPGSFWLAKNGPYTKAINER